MDRISGGRANDTINVADGDADDVVQCGKGKQDEVSYDDLGTAADKVSDTCEMMAPQLTASP